MIKVLVMDVDGTLTDGKIYLSQEGELLKRFDIKDGYGIKNICHNNNIITVVLTGRKSIIVNKRCEELDVKYVYQGVSNKVSKLNELSTFLKTPLSKFAYIGDDLNDIECVCLINENGGETACPSDGDKTIFNLATYKCQKRGGEGAVREFIDYLSNKL